MGCSSCGSRKSIITYPREVSLDDGTTVTVQNAVEEREKQRQARQRVREANASRGFGVRPA